MEEHVAANAIIPNLSIPKALAGRWSPFIGIPIVCPQVSGKADTAVI